MVTHGCESWTIKKTEHWRIDAFELWCGRRLLRVPWTASKFNQSILNEISPEYSLEGLMLKLKLQYFGHLMRRLFWKDFNAREDWRWEEKGTTEDETVGWHYSLNEHELEKAPGVGDGQGSLMCCSPWGCKKSDTTEQLNWTDWITEKRAFYYFKLIIRVLGFAAHFIQKQRKNYPQGINSKGQWETRGRLFADYAPWVLLIQHDSYIQRTKKGKQWAQRRV